MTENGIATADDTRRIDYTGTALHGLRVTMDDGIDVRGYIHWSLLDNFEWVAGYKPTFGLVAVDRQTFAPALPSPAPTGSAPSPAPVTSPSDGRPTARFQTLSRTLARASRIARRGLGPAVSRVSMRRETVASEATGPQHPDVREAVAAEPDRHGHFHRVRPGLANRLDLNHTGAWPAHDAHLTLGLFDGPQVGRRKSI